MPLKPTTTYFNPELTRELITITQGKSSIARLCKQEPIPFNGTEQFTFDLDNEVDVVAENGKKSKGGATIEPVKIIPVKIEYGARFSDEFMHASDEYLVSVTKSFTEGFAKKLARGIDLMALHGINPRTGEKSDVIGKNNFDDKVTNKVTKTDNPDQDIEAAVQIVLGGGGLVTGLAVAPQFAADLAKYQENGRRPFEELAWGGNPDKIRGLDLSVNETVAANQSKDRALAGNFAERFKWGYADSISFEVIEYGDPDNTGKDLKGYNQVYLRSEAYVGWGILQPASFALVNEADSPEGDGREKN